MTVTRLKQERERKGQSTYEVARAVGLSQSQYFRVESGELSASPEVAEKLAAHFGMKVTKLFSPLRYTPEPAGEAA